MPATRDGKLWRSQFYYKDWQGVRRKKNKRGFKTNVFSFCNLTFTSLQFLYTLHCCVLIYGFTISSSFQYHDSPIRFPLIPNSFFAFSNVRFEIPFSSARLTISSLFTTLFVSANS